MDTLVSPIMTELLSCLCSRLADTNAGEPGFCGIVPGPIAIADRCSCADGKGGMAWVRLVRVFASTNFPAVDSRAATCFPPMAAEIEVGTFRCVSVTGPTANQPPTPEQLAQDTIVQNDDMRAILAAFACCETLQAAPYVLGQWLPTVAGDCGGGTWSVMVALRQRTPDEGGPAPRPRNLQR